MMSWRRLAIEIFIIVAISALLGAIGPFGTSVLPLPVRLLYWIGVALVGYIFYRPVLAVARWLSEETAIPLWLALVLAAALASLPLTFVVGFVFSGMRSEGFSGLRYNPAIFGDAFPLLYLQVFGIGIAIQIAMRLLFGDVRAENSEPALPPPAPRTPLDINELAFAGRPDAAFFRRLPPELGNHLVCLEMQDHYVKAHTLKGSTMLLMRLKDAIAELGGLEGMQVHRSWWVARSEVRAIRREGRNIRLELANGILAPVSRNRQEALKREGWL
ncbi:LytTR family DNA-binding domain-containing protein [Parasphingopyxis marina]|uniref:LytTR family transcriptional regulator n=1 Tax=Parasphingopyxis marina TaxID=2761622 RepID=A0A842HUY1_9SPHN|nr:LytTR family DNA-binding domain-containing protein [Parasphingopyxis marina]MBC2776237.1 LytTR family transcriptional regulator [Parasphingopyxis marina]